MNLSCKIIKKLQICASPSASAICSMGIKRSNRNKCLNCKYYIPKIAYEGLMQGLNAGELVKKKNDKLISSYICFKK